MKSYDNSWHSYPSIFALGHRALANLLDGPVIVEEKIDGSQFSFGKFLSYDAEGKPDGGTVLRARSKGCVLMLDAPEKMFARAVEVVRELEPLLHVGWTYRAEYLAKPKHNALAYDRIPLLNLIVFDVNDSHEGYLGHHEKWHEARRLGLQAVPLLHAGHVSSVLEFRRFLEAESCLGGQKVEGVVVKPLGYGLFGPDKKVLMGKFVSEAFKEAHSKSWREENPRQGDILERLADRYTTPARWAKAAQHLRERGALEGSPRDIAGLIKEVPVDIEKECREELQEALWAWAWPHLRRMCTRGLPEWYKEELLKAQFRGTVSHDSE